MKSAAFALLVLVGTFALSSASFAAPEAPKLKPFSARMKLPAVGENCAEHAQAVAQAFAQATEPNTQGVQGVCQMRQSVTSASGETYSLDVIVLHYLAVAKQQANLTVYGGSDSLGSAKADYGAFGTYAECLNELEVQTPIFTEQTGLVAYTAYCQAATNELHPGYSLTFESFGEFKKNRLYTFSMGSDYGSDGTQTTEAVRTALLASGGKIVWSGPTRLFYYFAYPIQTAVQTMGIFKEEAQCGVQVAAAHAIFDKAGFKGVSSYCLVSPPPAQLIGKVPNSYILTGVGAGSNDLIDTSEGHYDSYDECSLDLGRVIQNRISSGANVFGGVCAPSMYTLGRIEARVYVTLL